MLTENKFELLNEFLGDSPIVENNVLSIIEDIKFGVVDSFLFSKAKHDDKNIYSNSKLILLRFNKLGDVAKYVANTKHHYELHNKTIISYRMINDNYHFQFIRVINKNDIDKYTILFE